jgi:prophage maintenance system killer protein
MTNEQPNTEPLGRGEVVIYQTGKGAPALDVRLDKDTVWLSQRQMADLFDKDSDTIGLHIRNVLKEGELEEGATTEDSSVVQLEGGRQVRRRLRLYNLDMILSVGYRVSSKRGTQFRIWATGVLREHLTRGITVNRQRLETNAREIEAALELARRAVASPQLTTDMGRGLVEIIARYTQTFLLLQRYDEGLLTEPKGEPGGALPSAEEARSTIVRLKEDLLSRREAGDLFGQEREEGLASILGNLRQSAFGQPAYPSVESKAAHLLYFVIKNHPFSDGNKRIAAMLFVDFLNRNGRLFLRSGEAVLNDAGLAALALLIAESHPRDKDVLVRLTMNMLARITDSSAC